MATLIVRADPQQRLYFRLTEYLLGLRWECVGTALGLCWDSAESVLRLD